MTEIQTIATGIADFDQMIGGGLPVYTTHVVAGRPGIGKTILAQQICFNVIGDSPPWEGGENGGGGEQAGRRVLYLTTISEPPPKIVRFMQGFSFFDAELFGTQLVLEDLGGMLRDIPFSQAVDVVMSKVAKHRPDLMVIDSFRAIRDLRGAAGGEEDFRLFAFDLASRLAGARVTTLLLGEYGRSDVERCAEFAVADGIVFLDMTDEYGEPQRTVEILKLRGRKTDRRPSPFIVSGDGIRVLGVERLGRGRASTPEPAAATSRQQAPDEPPGAGLRRVRAVTTGIAGLDQMLGGGVPRGRSVLLAGQSGSGKTTLMTQFLLAGCEAGERSLLVSFEESQDRLREMAEGFGWDLAKFEDAGILRIIHIRQPDLRVMEHTDMIATALAEFAPHRFALDSLSVFLHRMSDRAVQREAAFRLVDLARNAGTTSLFLTAVPVTDQGHLTRFGIEDTVVDGIVSLSLSTGEYGHRRYLQIHKMRACRHVTGRKRMAILEHGLEVFYQPIRRSPWTEDLPTLRFRPFSPDDDGPDAEEVPYGLAWLARGSGGSGKTSIAYQFALEGLAAGESVVYLSADSPIFETQHMLEELSPSVAGAVAEGRLRFLSLDDEATPDATDPEGLLYTLDRVIRESRRPLRLVIDSLWPLAAQLSPDQFVSFVRQKNKTLRRPDLAMLDTSLTEVLDERNALLFDASYDAIIDVERVSESQPPAGTAPGGGRTRATRFFATMQKTRGWNQQGERLELQIDGCQLKRLPSPV